jgi:hypothetical protein
MDNNHGKWPPFPEDEGRPAGWYLSVMCPVHATYAPAQGKLHTLWEEEPERPRPGLPGWLEETDEGISMLGKGADDE